MLPGELPLEGPSCILPVGLEIEEAFGEGVEVGKIVGRENFALDDREVDLDLVEPAGVNWGVDEGQAGIPAA